MNKPLYPPEKSLQDKLTPVNNPDPIEYYVVPPQDMYENQEYKLPFQTGDICVLSRNAKLMGGDFCVFGLKGDDRTWLGRIFNNCGKLEIITPVAINCHVEDVLNIRCVMGFMRKTKKEETNWDIRRVW